MHLFRAFLSLPIFLATFGAISNSLAAAEMGDEFENLPVKTTILRDPVRLTLHGQKLLIPMGSDAKSRSEADRKVLDLFKSLKDLPKYHYGTELRYREYKGDYLFQFNFSGNNGDTPDGEEDCEGDPEFRYLIRVSGKDWKTLWAVKHDLFYGKIQEGSLYAWDGSHLMAKIDLSTGKELWKNDNPFGGEPAGADHLTFKGGTLEVLDSYKRVAVMNDATGKVLRTDTSKVPHEWNPPLQTLPILAGFGAYITYSMFEDGANTLAWVNGSCWAVGLLGTLVAPTRTDQTNHGNPFAVPFLTAGVLSFLHPFISLYSGYVDKKDDRVIRGWIGLGAETASIFLVAALADGSQDKGDRKEKKDGSETSLAPVLSHDYSGLVLTQAF